MKPKNILAYSLPRPIALNHDQLTTPLDESKFMPCGSQDKCKFGWVSPMGKHGEQLLHSGGDCLPITREDIAQRFYAEVVLFIGKFTAFLPDLFSSLGGLEAAK